MKLTRTRKFFLLALPTPFILFLAAAAPLIAALVGGVMLGVVYSQVVFADEMTW